MSGREETAAPRGQWHSLSAPEAVARLESDERAGLSEREARRRFGALGPNELAKGKRTPAVILFLKQFNDFMIWVLLAAVVISGALLREYMDALVILVVVLLNAALGFTQESRAETALERLKELSAPTVKVIRDASEKSVPSRDLVPGDLILLETGDRVAADARLLSAVRLLVNESSLTGESEAAAKDADATLEGDAALGDRVNMVFSGTHVEYGRAPPSWSRPGPARSSAKSPACSRRPGRRRPRSRPSCGTWAGASSTPA